MKRIGRIVLLVCLLVLLGTQLAQAQSTGLDYTVTSVDSYTGYVLTKGSRLRLRMHPKRDARILAKLPNGTELTVIGETDYYLQVVCNGVTGFVQTRYVSKTDPLTRKARGDIGAVTNASLLYSDFQALNPQQVVVRLPRMPGTLNMRRGPSKQEKLVKYVLDGTFLTALATNGTWVQVLDPDTDQVGYVMSEFLVGLPE